MTERVPVYIIDTFTSEKFRGNPTPVCLTKGPVDDQLALSLAKEFNLPVAAFIDCSASPFAVRYFTHTGEIPACGHATLACARIVGELFPGLPANFKTIEKIIIPTQIDNDVIRMEYPRYELSGYKVPPMMLQSLGIDTYLSAGYCKELEAVFIELSHPDILESIRPDFAKLIASDNHITEVVITSFSNNINYDYLLRSFCPWIGIDEDPVTGSVHSVLACFWKKRTGKTNLKAWQASSRGGEVFVTDLPDKVIIGGKAILVYKGEISG